MFKCKECGTEYQTKPEYCDCGNDTFEEINLVERPKEKTKEETLETANTKPNIQIQESKEFVKTVTKKSQNIEPYAIIIFSICIILSLIVILFVANPKPMTENTNPKAQKAEIIDIPSIENLWNNSTEGISSYQEPQNTSKTEEKVQQKEIKQIQIDNSKKKVKTNSTVTQTQKTQSPTITQTIKPQSQKTKPVVTSNKTITTSKTNPQELTNYKIKLRNHIASKIAFTTIVGDGECSFSFKISQNGVLTNKAPNKLSDNDSLNEAVYNALRQVYSYNAPPLGYKNETLRLTVRMFNNNFEVYLN